MGASTRRASKRRSKRRARRWIRPSSKRASAPLWKAAFTGCTRDHQTAGTPQVPDQLRAKSAPACRRMRTDCRHPGRRVGSRRSCCQGRRSAARHRQSGRPRDRRATRHHRADIAKRCGVNPRVVNIIGAHHHELDQESLEAVIVEAADAISGARRAPGAKAWKPT